MAARPHRTCVVARAGDGTRGPLDRRECRAVSCCVHLRHRAHRITRRCANHARGRRGDEALRCGLRGRRGPCGLSAAGLRASLGDRRARDGVSRGSALYDLYGGARHWRDRSAPRCFAGPAPNALTVVPAVFGGVVLVLALSTLRAEDRWERWLQARPSRVSGRSAKWWKRAAGVPRALADGLRTARVIARSSRTAPLAAVAYWAFDLGALWASFRAFGAIRPPARCSSSAASSGRSPTRFRCPAASAASRAA
jgi:hypothetical protein